MEINHVIQYVLLPKRRINQLTKLKDELQVFAVDFTILTHIHTFYRQLCSR